VEVVMPSLLGTGAGVHYKSLKTVNQLRSLVRFFDTMMISTLIYITLHYDCGFAISCHRKQ